MTLHPAPHRPFDPEAHRETLEGLVRALAARIAADDLDANALHALLRQYPRDGRGFFSRAEIIAGYRALLADVDLGITPEAFTASLKRRPVRTQSGVTPVTVLTKPFPCPGKCIFCPNDVRMPKSYLSDEPGAQRAAANRFDPYLQTWNRLAAYRAIGHPTEKIELIVLGGTWSFYPEPYQIWFAKRCFDALNDFGAGVDRTAEVDPITPVFDSLPGRLDGRQPGENPYNRVVSDFLRERQDGELLAAGEGAGWDDLAAAHVANETAACRCVGFAIETRPDHVTVEEVLRIRRLGCTKVQIGIQSLDDQVLAANRRGHDVATTRRALLLLRAAGFKLHAHWMPNLLGATPESDLRDFDRLFEDPHIRPDELKIYPCSLIESAELMRYFESGAFRPYDHDELLDLLATVLEKVPRYCRVTRVVRDISSDDIVTGNKLTNFRQLVERAIAERGGRCVDIRAREIRRSGFDADALALRTTRYETSLGDEIFLESVTPDDRIVAFLRLSLPQRSQAPRFQAPEVVAELADSAMIREVHVYGAPVGLGRQPGERAQHRGLGGRLTEEAARLAAAEGYADLAVISAVGTRAWYRRLGFVDGPLYQHRSLRSGSFQERADLGGEAL